MFVCVFSAPCKDRASSVLAWVVHGIFLFCFGTGCAWDLSVLFWHGLCMGRESDLRSRKDPPGKSNDSGHLRDTLPEKSNDSGHLAEANFLRPVGS